MKVHVLKTWPEPFQLVLEGKKTAEVRIDDRLYEIGDVVVLRQFMPAKTNGHEPVDCFPARRWEGNWGSDYLALEVTDVTQLKGIAPAYVLLSFREADSELFMEAYSQLCAKEPGRWEFPAGNALFIKSSDLV